MTDTRPAQSLGPGLQPETRSPGDEPVRLVDTTMLYAPRSGGVRRYLSSKRAWLASHRPDVRHTLVVPGARDFHDGRGQVSIYAAPLPFGAGYRWPVVKQTWMERLIRQQPDLIEAGDPYTPGLAALRAGDALGVPVVGFCHTDLGKLAALHIGDWAEKPVQKRWAAIYRQFDQAVAPSRFIAGRLIEAGVRDAIGLPLGVDTAIFHPERGDRDGLRRRLGLSPKDRLLVFAGRPAREKKLDVLVAAVERLGDPYKLLFVGAGGGAPVSDRTLCIDYVRDPVELASILASCDAFVHANDNEPFGLIVLEAMACGLPVVGVSAGGVAESVDAAVGQLSVASEAAAFADAIEALFERDVTVVGEAARRRAVERHGWDAVFTELCLIYDRLTGRRAFSSASAHAGH
ncbi:glycosyltransferase family 1 protein [Caulobacter vibrioides]|uniref:glycosyltransferase family 4 protein n=1 Tax=Caulobacter vibrioides TaxID=155892 RepID=UPI000BB4F734|nr:glycosyltransferase family 1 protein [Caulobacter vibrioides]ATC24920.1 glycosyltransferase family 1 protein [Caulobacter vibrioides]AZH13076.1 glycosyltransferase family 1 protein [Caulobacter vibrioides]PLR09698.1 glycosyltransferase family 1 protein [Caulobacter vibrioides]